MIPRQGRRYRLNQNAQLLRLTQPDSGDVTLPTMFVGGIQVTAYVDEFGVFRVKVATPDGEIDPRLKLDADGNPSIQISVNNTNVFEA